MAMTLALPTAAGHAAQRPAYRKVGHCAYNPDECDPGSADAT